MIIFYNIIYLYLVFDSTKWKIFLKTENIEMKRSTLHGASRP